MRWWIGSVVALAVALASVVSWSQHRLPLEDDVAGAIPVIVELFTSQACENCRAGEALLAALDDDQLVPGALVIPLEYHVDYWNRRTVDPFSSAVFTERQRAYHELLGSQALYTPEMVVDGQMRFVGGQRRLAEHAIARAAATPKGTVRVVVASLTAERVEMEISLSSLAPLGWSGEVDLWVAVTERGFSGDRNGAGAGAQHAAVVRSLNLAETLHPPLQAEYLVAASIAREPAWRAELTSVVVFLQERQSRVIRGAAQSPLLSR